MITYVLLPLMVLTAAYGAIILGLIWALRRVGTPARWAIFLGFVSFGIGTGLLAAWVWPLDSSIYPNVWATLLGDALYQWSTSAVGDTWLLIVPRVYVSAAVLLYGGLGLLVQWVYHCYQLVASRARAVGGH
jgi:hypothetical protein